ncbi:hypothetical protein BJ085DRAFT_35760 [Dimargaris cristalligena]|uniref:Ubiquitin-like-conjugating enzyme ATG10 n=1 Tax=Dimargaris cristalligena TaxID=215637 RepID=A0A4Q0A0U3_9FUNG|nr:hypothetical protein BJ085DRAFT_35760 [Dimargaris cristalligena]|eukprot:RKP39673.1 hypothetical protein BJ085DRAFT_35760 [Dimargaris cristalligena]
MAADGTLSQYPCLTPSQFTEAAQGLIAIASTWLPGNSPWHWVTVSRSRGPRTLTRTTSPASEPGYLVHKQTKLIAENTATRQDEDLPYEPEDIDPSALPINHTANGQWIETEYHIVYSASYQVPVLHFRSTYLVTGETLDLDSVQRHVISQTWKPSLDSVPYGGAISMQDHPFLGVPYFYIHPCNTTSLLASVDESPDATLPEDPPQSLESVLSRGPRMVSNYLLTWLSLIGQAVGLELVIERFPLGKSVNLKAEE